MALIILGKTECTLCGKPLLENDEVVGFPAFLPTQHQLSQFSDAAFHKACFDNAPEHQAVEDLYRQYRIIWDSRPDLKDIQEIEAWGKEVFKEFLRS